MSLSIRIMQLAGYSKNTNNVVEPPFLLLIYVFSYMFRYREKTYASRRACEWRLYTFSRKQSFSSGRLAQLVRACVNNDPVGCNDN